MREPKYAIITRLLLFNLATDADDSVLGFTTRWIQEFAAQSEQIDVLTMRAGRIDVPENVRVYSVGKEKGYSEPRRVLEFYRILWSLLRQHRYDGCFAHMMPLFAVMAAPLLKLRRIPMVLWYTHKAVTPILRSATCVVDRVVTASPESFRIKSRKVRVIGHGIDTSTFAPLTNRQPEYRPFTILTVGRLSPIKRVELLIQAVGMLHQQRHDWPLRLLIVGGPVTERDRVYAAQLNAQVQQDRLQNIVVFVGDVPFRDVASYYHQADCFVNLSETGAIDKTVLEAMSCGLVVLANPVFAKVFGAALAQTCIVEWNVAALCDRLRLIARLSSLERQQFGQQLRAIVVRDHDLRRLCKKVVAEFQ